jgi:dipeptidyl aminopeptidase/acylaminoacyl peptidase
VIGWDQVELVEPIEVAVPSLDGITVPGRLYRPSQGIEPLPTIVAVHGGPTDQTRVEWNPRFASYVAAGWQVLVVDHRGSTGWGREHQQAMNERWGELDVADVVAVVDALVANGRIDPHRVVISGGSAGGFTVLSALVSRPGLFAGGIALYPVTDLIALDESTHRFEAHYQQTLIGNRPEHDERYISRSPLHRASAIRVPLLLFHGTDDKVVDIAQSDRLAAVLGAHGVPLDYTRFDGEGHGWSKPETVATEHRLVTEFLGRIMNPN